MLWTVPRSSPARISSTAGACQASAIDAKWASIWPMRTLPSRKMREKATQNLSSSRDVIVTARDISTSVQVGGSEGGGRRLEADKDSNCRGGLSRERWAD